jgi:hypothetical protein
MQRAHESHQNMNHRVHHIISTSRTAKASKCRPSRQQRGTGRAPGRLEDPAPYPFLLVWIKQSSTNCNKMKLSAPALGPTGKED